MSNNPRNIIEQSVYTPTPGEAQGVWKPWEDLQAMYTSTWPGSVNPLSVEYFIVSGGGSSGSWVSSPVQGAGGAGGSSGGLLTGTSNFISTSSVAVTVGAGSARSTARTAGSSSAFGAFSSPINSNYPASVTQQGGGGGSASPGTAPTGTNGGNGGQGTVLDWEAISITVAGGGGGGGGNGGAFGQGGGTGFGGGGNGSASVDSLQGVQAPLYGTDGTANTGGGGGAPGGYYNQASGTSWNPLAAASGAGGSGVVWIRYPVVYQAAKTTTNVAAGYPVINNGYRIYKWITSGSIQFQ